MMRGILNRGMGMMRGILNRGMSMMRGILNRGMSVMRGIQNRATSSRDIMRGIRNRGYMSVRNRVFIEHVRVNKGVLRQGQGALKRRRIDLEG